MSAVPVTTTTTTLKRHIRRKSRAQSAARARVTLFFSIVACTYLVSSLLGQVMVEKARREGIAAVARALDARKMEAVLTRRLDSLTSITAIDEWAKTHNFFAPDQLADQAAQKIANVPAGKTNELMPMKSSGMKIDEPSTILNSSDGRKRLSHHKNHKRKANKGSSNEVAVDTTAPVANGDAQLD